MNEAEVIRAIVGTPAPTSETSTLRVGVGDDAAVLRIDGDLVVSTDISIEGRHFDLGWISPREAGCRAVSAALSDLAAMGADPVAVVLSIAGPDAAGVADAGRGGHERAGDFEVRVVGGDVSTADALTIDVGVLGRVPSRPDGAGSPPWLRSGAHLGDEVWLTGRLGGPAAALQAWRAGGEPSHELRARFVNPTPRLVEARILADAPIHAAIDISDGLLMDAHRVAAASGVRIALDSARLPVLEAAAVDATTAAGSGEEYELLLFAPGMPMEVVSALEEAGCELTRVGEVVHGSGVTFDGRPVDPTGFDHFGGEGL